MPEFLTPRGSRQATCPAAGFSVAGRSLPTWASTDVSDSRGTERRRRAHTGSSSCMKSGKEIDMIQKTFIRTGLAAACLALTGATAAAEGGKEIKIRNCTGSLLKLTTDTYNHHSYPFEESVKSRKQVEDGATLTVKSPKHHDRLRILVSDNRRDILEKFDDYKLEDYDMVPREQPVYRVYGISVYHFTHDVVPMTDGPCPTS